MEFIRERQWKRQGGSCLHRAIGEAGAPKGLEEAPAASCVGSEGHVIPLPQSP